MVEALFEVGPVEYHSSGEPIPITWPTLWAFGQATGDLTEPWEYRAVIAMSRSYIDGKTRGEDVFCMPPDTWGDD